MSTNVYTKKEPESQNVRLRFDQASYLITHTVLKVGVYLMCTVLKVVMCSRSHSAHSAHSGHVLLVELFPVRLEGWSED